MKKKNRRSHEKREGEGIRKGKKDVPIRPQLPILLLHTERLDLFRYRLVPVPRGETLEVFRLAPHDGGLAGLSLRPHRSNYLILDSSLIFVFLQLPRCTMSWTGTTLFCNKCIIQNYICLSNHREEKRLEVFRLAPRDNGLADLGSKPHSVTPNYLILVLFWSLGH